ncbi:unnamed protein product, partial [Mycena citricolor]
VTSLSCENAMLIPTCRLSTQRFASSIPETRRHLVFVTTHSWGALWRRDFGGFQMDDAYILFHYCIRSTGEFQTFLVLCNVYSIVNTTPIS